MSALSIIRDNKHDVPSTSQIKATNVLLALVCEFVSERKFDKVMLLYSRIAELIQNQFNLVVDRADAHFLYTALMPPAKLVSISTIGGRLLREAGNMNGRELREAVVLYIQLMEYNNTRLSAQIQSQILNISVKWGSGRATEQVYESIVSALNAVQLYADTNVNIITMDIRTVVSHKQMIAHNIRSRRALMDSLIEGVHDKRLHEILITLRYLRTYAALELTEARVCDSPFQLSDKWSTQQSRAENRRDVIKEVVVKPMVFQRGDVGVSLHESDESIDIDIADTHVVERQAVLINSSDVPILSSDTDEFSVHVVDDGKPKTRMPDDDKMINITCTCDNGDEQIVLGRYRGEASTDDGKRSMCVDVIPLKRIPLRYSAKQQHLRVRRERLCLIEGDADHFSGVYKAKKGDMYTGDVKVTYTLIA